MGNNFSRANLTQVAADWEQRSLKNVPSYHWEMSAEEAVLLLRQTKEPRCYLLRHNSQKSTFKLTVKGSRLKGKKVIFEHYMMLIKQGRNGNTYQIKSKDKIFDKLTDLLAYYEKNPIGYKMKNIGVPLVHDEYSRPGSAYLPSMEEETAMGSAHRRRQEFRKGRQTMDLVVDIHPMVQNTSEVHTPKTQLQPAKVRQMSHPKLELLTQIAWVSVQGTQKLEILNTVSAKWRNIGILLGQKIADLDRYQKIEGNDNKGCCIRVFNHWIDSGGHVDYPVTWKGLEDLLHDIEHGGAAEKLKNALVNLGIWQEDS